MSFFSGLGSLFGGDGMKYLDQAMDIEKEYLNPFIDRGNRAGDIIEDEYGRMVSDPSAMIDHFMEGYQPSKYYQLLQDRMGQAAANTAAAGGMRGSPREQLQQQELTQALLGKDMQQYLNNVMGLHGQGLAGEQGLYGIGFQGATNLADALANILGNKAKLSESQAAQGLAGFGDILGGITKAMGMMGGGGMAGAAMLAL